MPRLLGFVPLFFAAPLWPQAVTGSVQGAVVDPAGARVAAVRVALIQEGTALTRSAGTDSLGRFVFPAVAAGRYRLTAEREGFKRGVVAAFDVTVNQAVVVDIPLALGERSEEVRVAAQAELLETQNATVSGLVDSRRVTDLPLNGRNFAQLINLQPGVAIISSHGLLGGGPDAAGIQGSGQYVNGARGSVNNFLFDGGDANDPVVPGGTGASSTAAFTGGAPGVNGISVDAIQEFRVITSGAQAEFGRSSGAVVNIVTKSGTNQPHGAVFHFLRNRALNARNTFEAAKPAFTQNNFGASLGGPVRRDRTFFFANFEGFRQRQSVSVVNPVPSPNTIVAVGRQNRLLGALLGAYFSGPAAAQPGSFTDRPVETILAQGVPVVGSTVLPRGNGVDQNALLYKIDQTLRGGGRLTGRHQVYDATGIPGTISGTGIAGSNVGYNNRSQNAVLNWTQPFGPLRLNEFRAVLQRNTPRATFEPTPAAMLDAGRLRTDGPNAGQPYGPPDTPNGIPTIPTVGFGITSVGYDVTAPNRRGVTTFQVSETFTRASGAHTVKAGFEWRRVRENSVFSFRLRPEVNFQSGGALSILAPGAPVSTYDQNLFVTPATSQRGFRVSEWGWFVQDTVRLSPRLTLDLGLRHEYNGRPYEVNGYLNNAFLAPGGTPMPGAHIYTNGVAGLRDLRLYTVGRGRSHDAFPADLNNLAPRVGLAWKAARGTAVRLAYGIFYDRIFNNVFGNARNSPPFALPVTLAGTPFGAIPAADAFQTTLPIGPVTINPALKTAYTQRFSANFQRELGRSTVLEAGYVGARGLKLIRTIRANQGAAFPFQFRPGNIDAPERPRTLDDFRPLNYGNMSTRDSSGASTYHSLQAGVQRRFSGGLYLQANYTLGSATDVASGEILTDVVITTITNTLPVRTAAGLIPTPSLDTVNQARRAGGMAPLATVTEAARYFNANFTGPGQWRAEIGRAAFDVRHILVANAGYDLPWGGWQILGVARYQSGIPVTLNTGVDVNGDGNAPDRAALLSGSLDAIIRSGGGRSFLNPSTAGRGSAGQAVRVFDGAVVGVSERPQDVASYMTRGALTGRALRAVDVSLIKKIALGERARLQIRGEFFNVLNLTNLGAPVASLASPLFGQILATSTPPRQIQFGARIEF
ncbi:MAG: TonB-dependent receptor [Acidobacteria bacterium]|nr:TonB-dependent receptor [Acidobacteriota bacterium]